MSSVVRFNITQRTAEGTRVPIVDGGRVVLEPTRLIVVEGDPDEMVIPARITAPLVDGRADVLMDATGVAWCWRIVVRGARRDPLQEGYYTIPESAVPLDYPADLVEVDPETLAPAESAVPAWEAAVEAVQGHEDAAALAATQAAGSASSAAVSAQSAADSASSASGSAGTATTKASEASTSAANAASSASAANVSATNADASNTAAAGSATSAAASASQAANSASTASTKATEATNSATAAIASASAADASATAAASSAATASAAQAATEAVDITVGTVTTGMPADAVITGTAPSFTLDLTIPEGDPGPVNSLSIGTVTTGAPGTEASATITGEAPEQVLNLMLPKGDAGGIVNPSLLPLGESIDNLASGLYHAQYAGSIANGYPFEGFLGYLMVGSRSSSYRFQVAYSSNSASRGAMWVRVRNNSTTWHPWVLQHSTGAVGGGDLTGSGMPNGVVTAPPGTYYTDTAGTNGAWRWLKTSGTGNTGWYYIVGDTGWRNLASIAVNSWIGRMRLRRIGSTCSLYLDFVRGGTAVEVLTLTDGFRPHENIKTNILGGGVLQTIYLSATGVLTKQNTAHSGPTNGGEVWSWLTNDAWPTTLPGTPA